jgi:hypothetical protein
VFLIIAFKAKVKYMSMAGTSSLPALAPPMKKTQKYYSFRENLWNHTYFTCAKVAKFYQRPQANYYKTHPTEEQLRDMQENERLERRDQRAQAARLLDSNRLHRRKLERAIVSVTQLQSRSKQQVLSASQPVSLQSSIDKSAMSVRVFRPAPVPQVQKNGWAEIDFLPVQQIKKFLPRKELELDDRIVQLGATEQLLARRTRYQAQQAAQSAYIRQQGSEARAELARRHQATENLERKSGILKYRADSLASTLSSLSSAGPYGPTKNSTASPRSKALSQARDLYHPKDPLLYAEFRGLIQAQHRNAVLRMRTELSRSASMTQFSAPNMSLARAVSIAETSSN